MKVTRRNVVMAQAGGNVRVSGETVPETWVVVMSIGMLLGAVGVQEDTHAKPVVA